MDWKNKIKVIVDEMIGAIAADLDAIERQTEEKRAEYKNILSQYTELQKELSQHKSKMIQDIAEIDKERKFVEDQRQLVEEDSRAFAAEATKIQEELIQKRDEISALEKTIAEKKSELKTIAVLESQKEILIKDLDKLSKDSDAKLAQLKEIETAISVQNSKLVNVAKEIELVKGTTLQEIETKLQLIANKERDVVARETNVKQKEADLVTVEKRWKKLYEEKGANFKI